MSTDQTSYLISLLSRFRVPFGMERSLKVLHRKLLPDRLLLSIHKQALGAGPAGELAGLLSELKCPGPACERLLEYLPAAEIVHLGYECDGPRLLYKCYLEFPGQYRSAQTKPDTEEGVLVHIAGKWEPAAAAVAFSHYHGFPGLECGTILTRIRDEIFGAGTGSVALEVLNELSGTIGKKVADEAMLMLVTEPGNDRLSFDLNIYDWERTLADIRPQMDRLMSAFDIPAGLSAGYLDSYAEDSAGHISGGYDRSGNEFFTLYHGVAEIVP